MGLKREESHREIDRWRKIAEIFGQSINPNNQSSVDHGRILTFIEVPVHARLRSPEGLS